MPMLPAPLMTKRGLVPSAVEEAISKELALLVSMPSVHWVPPLAENSSEGLVEAKMESLLSGVVVPMPMFPVERVGPVPLLLTP